MSETLPGQQYGETLGQCQCTVCREEGQVTPASRWCPTCKAAFCNECLQLHNRMPISKFHEIHQISDSEDVDIAIRFLCPTHKDEDITLYCRDCQEPICQPCRQRIHFICKSVVDLQDMLPEVRTKLRNIKTTLQSEITRRRVLISKRKSQKGLISEFSSKTETKIKETSKAVLNVIDAKELDLAGRLETVKRQLGGFQDDDTYEVPVFVSPFDKSSPSKSEDAGDYEEMQPSESSTDTTIKPEVKADQITHVTCNTKAIYEAIKLVDNWNVGTISLGVADLTSKPVLLRTIDTKTYKDKNDPVLKDVLVMVLDGIRVIVVSNVNTRAVKSFYTKHNRSHQSILELNERPNGMTVVEGNQIIATTPFSFQIHKISVYPDLRLSSSTSTMVSYYGITYIGQNLLAACVRDSIWTKTNKSQIHIIDLKGNMLRSIPVAGIQSPDFASFSPGGNILLSDVFTKTVISISQDGSVVFAAGFELPGGVVTSTTGFVLAVDRIKGTVVQLDSAGKRVRDILTTNDCISDVHGIFLDGDESLYVTSGQFVKVYVFE